MNEEGDIFSMVSQESHKGESVVSVLVIIVSVGFVVGLFYMLIGAKIPATAEYNTMHSNVFENTINENNININIPSDFSIVEKSEHVANDFFTKNLQYIKNFKNSQDHQIILIKANSDSQVSLLSILKSPNVLSPTGVKSSLISLSEHSKNKLEYSLFYQIKNQKTYSHETLYQVENNNSYDVYLVSYQVPSDLAGNYLKEIKAFFQNNIEVPLLP